MMQRIGDALATGWQMFGIPGVLVLLALVLIGVACTDQLINAWHERHPKEQDELTDEERAKLSLMTTQEDIYRTAARSWDAYVPNDFEA